MREIGTPVTVFGLVIADGDLVHADRHWALVIPQDYVAELGAAITRMQSTESIVLDAARAPEFDFAAFEIAWE